jgi:excisionase family DNA binding protein
MLGEVGVVSEERREMQPPMTVRELSEYLRLDRMTIYKMLKEGSIPASRIGHQWRFFRSEIDEWLRSPRRERGVSVLVAGVDQRLADLIISGVDPETCEVLLSTATVAADVARDHSAGVVVMVQDDDALALFKRIREWDSHVPVVVLTEAPDPDFVSQAVEIGPLTLAKTPRTTEELDSLLPLLYCGKRQAAGE